MYYHDVVHHHKPKQQSQARSKTSQRDLKQIFALYKLIYFKYLFHYWKTDWQMQDLNYDLIFCRDTNSVL